MQKPRDAESIPAVSQLERSCGQLAADRIRQIFPEITRHPESFMDVADERLHLSIGRRQSLTAMVDVLIPVVWARESHACLATTSYATKGQLATHLEHLHITNVIITIMAFAPCILHTEQ